MPATRSTVITHVVWDWNGTLLDDFDLTARIANRTLEKMGLPGVTGEDVRANFRRPFSDFYARLFGRPISADEYTFIRERYEVEYEAEVLEVSLQPDAHDALDLLAAQVSQSVLSMAHDDQLQALVDHHAIRARFIRIEGSPTTDNDGNKAERLARHLAAIEIDPARTAVIGDTVDDYEAAAACGARAVLITTGSTSRASLEATGAPVVDTLVEAAGIALATA